MPVTSHFSVPRGNGTAGLKLTTPLLELGRVTNLVAGRCAQEVAVRKAQNGLG
jgi:hypothetical protein